MKVIKTYTIEVEIDENEIASTIEDCGFTLDEAVEEFGSVEEFIEGYVDDCIVCHCGDEKLFKDVHMKKELSLA